MKKETSTRIYILLIYFLGFQILFPQLLQLFCSQLGLPITNFGINFIPYLLTFLLLLPILIKILKTSKKLKAKDYKHIIFGQLKIYLFSFVFNLLISLFFNMNGESANQSNVSAMAHGSDINILLYIVMVVFMGPIVEELCFRYAIFKGVRKHCSFIVSALISALLFGYIHVASYLMMGDLTQIVYLVPYAAMGYFMCRVYEQTNNFKATLLLHILNNFIATLTILI